jgi:hypothetical protein
MASCINRIQTYVADTPRSIAFFRCRGYLIGLAVDAQVHDMVATDGAVVNDDVYKILVQRVILAMDSK